MTEKSEIDLLYEAADIAGFNARNGWPEVLEWDQFFSLMLGHRWLPPLRELQPITMEYPDGRIEQCGYTPDLRIFDTPETAQRRKASIIIARMLNDAGLKIEERDESISQSPMHDLVLTQTGATLKERPPKIRRFFVVTRDAATACLHAIGKSPPEHVRAWLGPVWQEEAPKVGAGKTAPAADSRPGERETYFRSLWLEFDMPARNEKIWKAMQQRRGSDGCPIVSVTGNEEFVFRYSDKATDRLERIQFQKDMSAVRAAERKG